MYRYFIDKELQLEYMCKLKYHVVKVTVFYVQFLKFHSITNALNIIKYLS
jgi:hypothetical protein